MQEILNRGVEAELQLTVDLVIERINRLVQPLEAVAFVHRHEGLGDGGHVGIRLVDQARDASRAAAIDHGIGEIGRDDLPPKAMVFHRIGEFVPNLVREVLGQFAGEIGIVGHAGGQQVIVQRQLGVSEQHGEFRPRKRLAAPGALGDRHIVRQEFHGSVKEAALLE